MLMILIFVLMKLKTVQSVYFYLVKGKIKFQCSKYNTEQYQDKFDFSLLRCLRF